MKTQKEMLGLTAYSTTAKYMIAGRDRSRLSDSYSEVVIDGDAFEAIKKFKYLAAHVICGHDVSSELKSRISAANKDFDGLRYWLRLSNLHMQTQFA